MKRWMILAAMVSIGLAGCDNSDGATFTREVKAELKQEGKKGKKKDDKKEDKKGDKKKDDNASSSVAVLQQWDMPRELMEVSGIAWYGADKAAAVQDETGTIFIYDLKQQKVEKQIPFAGKGDYEGVAVAGETIYALRSDGTVVEIINGQPKEYKTHLTVQHDTEGLFYDKKNDRLLVSVKAGESAGKKNIYAFDISSKKMNAAPVMSIDLNHQLLGSGKKIEDRFQPSDLAVHPTTGEVYVLDGANPRLMIMNSNGEIKEVHNLDKSVFKQPEGIMFSPQGDVYISSEGVKSNGVIVKVKINNVSEEAI